MTNNSAGQIEIGYRDSGRDLLQNFSFDDDRISVGNETITAVNVNSAGGVRIQISGFAVLTLNDAANYFVATLRNASLTAREKKFPVGGQYLWDF